MKEEILSMNDPIFIRLDENKQRIRRPSHQDTSAFLYFLFDFIKQRAENPEDVKFNYRLIDYRYYMDSDEGKGSSSEVDINQDNFIEFMDIYIHHPMAGTQIKVPKDKRITDFQDALIYLLGLEYMNRGTGQYNPYVDRAMMKTKNLKCCASKEYFHTFYEAYHATAKQTYKSMTTPFANYSDYLSIVWDIETNVIP